MVETAITTADETGMLQDSIILCRINGIYIIINKCIKLENDSAVFHKVDNCFVFDQEYYDLQHGKCIEKHDRVNCSGDALNSCADEHCE